MSDENILKLEKEIDILRNMIMMRQKQMELINKRLDIDQKAINCIIHILMDPVKN